MMKFQVLVSCMNQKDYSIVQKLNIVDPVVIVNQTDKNMIEKSGDVTFISTTERGLSKSRNKALRSASGQYCLLADDDEFFTDGLEEIVVNSFEKHPEVDIMIFKIGNFPKGQKNKFYKLKKLDLLKVASVQIAIKLSSIQNKIWFDENLGAGTINGAGEENKFLLDCYKYGMNISYMPTEIGVLQDSESTWFSGYSKEYFYTRGKILRYILGLPMTILYNLYFVLAKYSLYKEKMSIIGAFKYLTLGCLTKDINKKYEG